jgi:hypothetical protein
MRFTERCEFSGDPVDVWTRVSNLGALPSYWHGTREFKVREDGKKVMADVVFAFGGKGTAEVEVDEKGRTLTIDFVDGPFRGRQTVAVRDNAVEAEWNVDFRGVYKLLGSWEKSHFRTGTRRALKRICSGSTD